MALSKDTKLLLGGGVGIAALAYFTRRRARDQGGFDQGGFSRGRASRERHSENERGEYGGKKRHHHEERDHGD
jgi:hypothetical protein